MGVQPDLILILTIAYAFVDGQAFGSAIGFFGGLLQDLTLSRNIGLNALSKTIVGYLAGSMERLIFIESIFLPLVAIFLATLVSQTLYAGLAFLLGFEVSFKAVFRNLIFPSAMYNSLISVFIYPLLLKLILYQEH